MHAFECGPEEIRLGLLFPRRARSRFFGRPSASRGAADAGAPWRQRDDAADADARGAFAFDRGDWKARVGRRGQTSRDTVARVLFVTGRPTSETSRALRHSDTSRNHNAGIKGTARRRRATVAFSRRDRQHPHPLSPVLPFSELFAGRTAVDRLFDTPGESHVAV